MDKRGNALSHCKLIYRSVNKPILPFNQRLPPAILSVRHTRVAEITTIGGVKVNEINVGPLNKEDVVVYYVCYLITMIVLRVPPKN